MENQSQIFLVIFIKQLLLNNQLASPLIGLRKKSEAADLNNLLRIYYLIHNISNEVNNYIFLSIRLKKKF